MERSKLLSMNVDQLSDAQLYALFCNKDLHHDIKSAVREEIAKRDFSVEYLDRLGLEFEHKNGSSQTGGLSLYQKGLIILLPFFIVIHAILANVHISKGNMFKWKQHWRFITIGFLLWTIVIILIGRFTHH